MADEEKQLDQESPTAAPQAIDVKEAVLKSMNYFRELYGGGYLDLALEEVQKNPAGDRWLVTLGYSLARRTPAGMVAVAGSGRQYKQVTLNADTGEVLSMKVWKP